MAGWRQSLQQSGRWQAALVLFAAGALLSMGFAPYHCWWVLFLSLPIFYVLLTNAKDWRQALWRSFFFGYGHYMAGTWWIANALLVDAAKFGWLLPFSILGLSAVMSFWFMVFGLLVHSLRRRMNLLLFTALWVVIELMRSWGIFGFPWNLTGYMALASLPFAQMASLVGVYGLSFILVLSGLMPLYWLGAAARGRRIASALVFVVVIGVIFLFGVERLKAPIATRDVGLRIVQPNIPQQVKGTPDGVVLGMKRLEMLSAVAPKGHSPDVTIWPESAYPFTVRDGDEISLPKIYGTLLTGAVRAEGVRPRVKVWNTLLALKKPEGILAAYDKSQLVPFGEFVPLRQILPLDKITPGDTDFSRGQGPTTLRVKDIPPFSALVCYEAIFPALAVNSSERPEWILNITNDAWYGFTAGPYQHFEMARMRAIEQALPLVRAANNGISAVIDARGMIVASMGLGGTGILDTPLPVSYPANFYATYGTILTIGMLGGAIFLSFFRSLRRQK